MKSINCPASMLSPSFFDMTGSPGAVATIVMARLLHSIPPAELELALWSGSPMCGQGVTDGNEPSLSSPAWDAM